MLRRRVDWGRMTANCRAVGFLAAILGLAGFALPAHAQDVSAAATLALHGDSGGIPPCSSCHGTAGEGNAAAGYPRLAGLPATYLGAQLNALADGVRQSPVMGPFAKQLSLQQRLELAAYYAGLPKSAHAAVAAAGQLDEQVALRGRWSDEIPACVQCHGTQGSGVGSAFPPLAGQPSEYIASQLHAWKRGTRRGDPLGLMQAIASRLSEQDIRAVAEYFAASPTQTAEAHSAAGGSPRQGMSDLPASTAPADARQPRKFTPTDNPIPDDDFGKVVQSGRQIFDDPARYASQYVGNSLSCTNCHLDEGRRVGSAPLWAAYVSYPAYRAKNHHVNTFEERLQGCFRYSMNGKSPPLGDPVLVALESYAYWMAQGAPLDPKIPGRGYRKPPKPAPPDYQRGSQVYVEKCALCHGGDGAGQRDDEGQATFPALWGADSFNWGAGMGSVSNAAAFIKDNMPLGRGGTLSDQEAWDLALFMDSHERPQDPRYTGSVAETRAQFHDEEDWMYGKVVNGHLLGSDSVPPGPRSRGH